MNSVLQHSRLFVTGTDTDAGKTYVSERILQEATHNKLKCIGFKPVSAGCEPTKDGLRNDDALRLMAASSMDVDYCLVNPIAYQDPVAPHLAAKRQNELIDIDLLDQSMERLSLHKPDLLLVEGAGGWQLPLGQVKIQGQTSAQQYFMPDFVKQHKLPVLLVVGMKLGCLNHALLSYQAIVQSGCECIGWVANQIDPGMDYFEDNLTSLTELLSIPLLATVMHKQGGLISNR